MNNKEFPFKEIANVISKDFLAEDSVSLIPLNDSENFERFKEYLTERLQYLLHNKYSTLLNVLYRIDVNEDKLAKILSKKNGDLIPSALAELIIERQLQKIKFRQQFKSGYI